MPDENELIRIDPVSITTDRPLPFAVFLEDGTLLASAGCLITDAERVDILRTEGWRRLYPGEERPDAADSAALEASRQSVTRSVLDRSVPLDRTTVLVADDMPLARAMLSNILYSQGVMKVIQVEDGRKAISRFFTDSPELVMLDIDMPNLDGLCALKQIKSWSPGTFVCLVSANSTRDNVRVAQEQSVDGFIVKPYTPLNLKRVLARHESRQAGGRA